MRIGVDPAPPGGIDAENDGGRFISVGENVSRMPDITVSDDQRERLERVRAHLAEDVAYGHVRPRDALEFLLDRFESEAETEADPVTTASASAPAPASASSDGETAEDDGDADAEFEVRNGGAATASVVGDDADEATDAPDATGNGDAGEGDDAPESEASDGVEEADDARLNSVMSLLDDHDDVWREAEGGEEKYEVDLPDGGTERARTQDDVRAVLFRHYR